MLKQRQRNQVCRLYMGFSSLVSCFIIRVLILCHMVSNGQLRSFDVTMR